MDARAFSFEFFPPKTAEGKAKLRATWQELAVLPQLGEKRAQQIVEYRTQPNHTFKQPEDLLAARDSPMH